MADKKQAAPALSILASFALVFWMKSKNKRTEYGNTTGVRDSLAEHGWRQDQPVPVTEIQTDAQLTERDKAAGKLSEYAICMAERSAKWKALQEATTPEAATERVVFEKLFTRGGKLIEPKYCGNAGFRRASVFFDAMVIRFKDNKIEDTEKILDQVPVMVKSYSDEAERIVDQQLENELKAVGVQKMSDADRLRIAREFYLMGKREIYLRKLYSSSVGQKLFNTVQIDQNWPALNIYNRCFMQETDALSIPFNKVRAPELIKYNNRFDADQKRAKGQPLTEKERAFPPVTQEEVASYFNGLKEGAAVAEKSMARKDVEAMAKQNGVRLVRATFQSVLDNTVDSITAYVQHAEPINLLCDMIDNGQTDTAHKALILAKQKPELMALVREAVLVLSDDELTATIGAAIKAKKAPALAKV